MHRILFLIIAILSAGSSGTVTQILNIKSQNLSFKRYLNFDFVNFDKGIYLPEPGKPFLPAITATVVIPAKSRVTEVRVQPEVTELIPGSFNILPAQLPVPISSPATADFIPPDQTVYGGDEPYPDKLLINYSPGDAGGFQLVNLIICPFTYYPLSGRLLLHSRLRIKISYEPDNSAASHLTRFQSEHLRESLSKLVLNPEDLSSFAPVIEQTDQPQIDYLIITSPELAFSFQPYLEYRRARGFRTEIRTTDWIERNYPGRDLQEKIRNHIIDYYQNRGVIYVLLAGDNRQIPARQIRVDVGNEQGWIPTDLYYGDLDFSWDSNGNNLFGEMTDSVDLYADVFIGRASVETPAQVENFINKAIAFENTPNPDYIRRSLLPSGWLWRSLNYHGRFVNDSIANLTPSPWFDLKMENPPDARMVADSFDHGFLIFNPSGHGNETGVYDENGTAIYTTSFAARQQNHNRYSIITSLACNPGNFEAEDCLAEVALNCTNGGAIGVMMNSRYGWGTPPAMGPSEKLCVRFYDYLLERSEYRLGFAHNRSREEYAGAAIYSPLWRWCMTEFNLFGDPAADLWTDAPQPLTITTPDTIGTGNQSLTVTVRSNSIPASGVLVTAYKINEVLTGDTTDGNGVAILNLHPLTPGELKITATRHNNLPAVKLLTVVPEVSEPFLICVRQQVNDSGQANPNGVPEPGETVRLRLTIKNLGTAPATGTRLNLSESHPAIEIIQGTSELGTIYPQDSITPDNIIIAISPEALPGSSPELTLLLHCDQNHWQNWFWLNLGYSGRIWADIDTSDCSLTITARGSIGYDIETGRGGRGFRYPKSETSGLYLASFVLGNGPEYVVDRFYGVNEYNRDWRLNDSIRERLPIWNSAQLLQASFTDLGHHQPRNIVVDQRALSPAASGLENTVILVYDLWNAGSLPVSDLYAGILADFDVIATDRLHDLARTLPELQLAFMRNVNNTSRYFGIKLLYPLAPANLICLDHARYVYPDSAMTDDMKYRALRGTLGLPAADRPFNWSIGVSTGPFNLIPGQGKQRLAFAFIATTDSTSLLNTAHRVQEWFDQNVGIEEKANHTMLEPIRITVTPRIFAQKTTLLCQLGKDCHIRATAHDITGRTVSRLVDGTLNTGTHRFTWNAEKLAPGIYFIHIQTPNNGFAIRTIHIK